MSNGSRLSSTGGSGQPFTTIGARDLMQARPDAKTGFLRRRGKKERMVETLKLNAILQWRQVFVVVTDGYLYNFRTERSRGYFKVVPLQGYNRVMRVTERDTDCFRIDAADPVKQKHQIYSCISDNERKDWMKRIRQEMALANNVNEDSGMTTDSDDYIYLEKPLFESASSAEVFGNKFSNGSEEEEEEGSDDSDYDTITEFDTPKGREMMQRDLPPLPDEDAQPVARTGTLQYATPKNKEPAKSTPKVLTLPPNLNSAASAASAGLAASAAAAASAGLAAAGKKKPPPTPTKPVKEAAGKAEQKHDYINAPEKKPKPKPKGRNVKRTPSENEYFFNDSNREKALSLLRGKANGTYLIRNARQGDYKVLAVLVNDETNETKEYKIFSEADGVTLDHKNYFPSTEALLASYVERTLPNHSARLTRPYSSLD